MMMKVSLCLLLLLASCSSVPVRAQHDILANRSFSFLAAFYANTSHSHNYEKNEGDVFIEKQAKKMGRMVAGEKTVRLVVSVRRS